MLGFLRVEEERGDGGEEVIEEEEALIGRDQYDLESEQDTESELGRETEEVIKDISPMEDREYSEYENVRELDNSIANIIADKIDKLVGDEMSEEDKGEEDLDVSAEEEKICPKCGTTTTELLLHIAEVHLEEELEEEMLKVFPGSCEECMKCGKIFNNDYEKKEHISLQHPWDILACMVKEVINREEVVAKKNADNDEISDDDISDGEAGDDNNISDEEDNSFSNPVMPNETKLVKHVVSKMIEIKAEQPKGIYGAMYSCNKCEYTWKTKSGQRDIKYLIKIHICLKHFKEELEDGLTKHFKEKICTLCGNKLGSNGAVKKHLITTHKYLNDLISRDVDFVLANGTETLAGQGFKRKLVEIHDSELMQKLKVPKTDSSLGLVGEGRLKEDDDISHIQSRIEFSDSDSEDET